MIKKNQIPGRYDENALPPALEHRLLLPWTGFAAYLAVENVLSLASGGQGSFEKPPLDPTKLFIICFSIIFARGSLIIIIIDVLQRSFS